MPTAYGYTRVSHLDSLNRGRHAIAENGLSLGTQEETVRKRFERLKQENPDVEWGGLFEDKAVSAYHRPFGRRPEGSKLNMLLKTGDIVIFPRLDRAFRNGLDFFRMTQLWDERKIRFIYCDHDLDTSTHAGRSFIYFAAVQAHLHSSFISERTKEGLARRRMLGGLTGEVPVGKRVTWSKTLQSTFVIDDLEQRAIAEHLRELKRLNPDWGNIRLSDELEDWLADREGRKSFRGIRSRYQYSHRRVEGLLKWITQEADCDSDEPVRAS